MFTLRVFSNFENYSSLKLKEIDNQKQTPLHLACKYSSDRVFKLLIDSEKTRLEHICSSSFDFSPLHSACRSNTERSDIVERLLLRIIELKLNKMLRVHLNIGVRQKIIKNLLPMVVSRFELNTQAIEDRFNQKEFVLNKFEFIRVLDETSYFLKEIVNRKDHVEQRPLQLAVEQNYLDIASVLFKYGALSMLYSANRTLPIHLCAKIGSVDMFHLLERYNSVSFKSDGNMENLFHIAAYNNSVDFLKESCAYFKKRFDQLKNFKDVQFALDAVNNLYLTPLFLAASKSNTECVRVLIEMNPASKFYVDDFSRNIFHICCLFNSYNTFKFLIDYAESKIVEYSTEYGGGERGDGEDLQEKLLHFQEVYNLSSSNPSLLDNYMNKTLKNQTLTISKLIFIFLRFIIKIIRYV